MGRGVFRKVNITKNKRVARRMLWEHVVPLASYYGEEAPVLILPGESTEEIAVIRDCLHNPRIVACDLNPEAIKIARRAGVETVKGDVLDLVRNQQRDYVAAHFDACGVINTAYMERAEAVAARTLSAFGVTTSAGHWAVPEHLPARPLPCLEGWPMARRRRMEVLAAALPGWHLRLAMSYLGSGIAMLAALWCRRRDLTPVVVTIHDGVVKHLEVPNART